MNNKNVNYCMGLIVIFIAVIAYITITNKKENFIITTYQGPPVAECSQYTLRKDSSYQSYYSPFNDIEDEYSF